MKFILGGLVASHVLLKLFSHWFVSVKCFVQYSRAAPQQATHAKVGPSLPSKSAPRSPLHHLGTVVPHLYPRQMLHPDFQF